VQRQWHGVNSLGLGLRRRPNSEKSLINELRLFNEIFYLECEFEVASFRVPGLEAEPGPGNCI
jgi:hypothetical protein